MEKIISIMIILRIPEPDQRLTKSVVFVRREPRSTELREHLSRVLQRIFQIVGILEESKRIRVLEIKIGKIEDFERREKRESTRARCMWKAFCWRPVIPAESHFSSSSTPAAIILSYDDDDEFDLTCVLVILVQVFLLRVVQQRFSDWFSFLDLVIVIVIVVVAVYLAF